MQRYNVLQVLLGKKPHTRTLHIQLYGHVHANSSNLRVIKTKNYDGLFSGNFFQIRWFTPTNEVNLCGHATLATAAVLYNELGTL